PPHHPRRSPSIPQPRPERETRRNPIPGRQPLTLKSVGCSSASANSVYSALNSVSSVLRELPLLQLVSNLPKHPQPKLRIFRSEIVPSHEPPQLLPSRYFGARIHRPRQPQRIEQQIGDSIDVSRRRRIRLVNRCGALR